MSLFKRAAVFTDIHFGNKSNSQTFNRDCLDFVTWFCNEAKRQGAETCIFMGDWHHQRASINVATLNYSIQALELLNTTFDTVHFIPGNHDEYYRDKRDYNSIAFIKKFENIQFYNDITTVDGVAFIPWLVGEEHKQMRKVTADYVIGHFELPHFYMNAMVQMPDHGELNAGDFGRCGTVFTGHFHKRQEKENVVYTGNAFPHNYSDAWDDDRGMMLLDWDGTREYIAWPEQPKYRMLKISQLLEGPEKYLGPKTYARVNLDVDISYEEANFIKETFMDEYQLREMSLIPVKVEDMDMQISGEINFESVDTIVTSQLQQIDSQQYDTNLMLDIYRNL
jgi:DNA repair exonuclease SbcCD nuclease subunit